MADSTLKFVIEVQANGEPVVRRLVSGFEQVETAAGKAGAKIVGVGAAAQRAGPGLGLLDASGRRLTSSLGGVETASAKAAQRFPQVGDAARKISGDFDAAQARLRQLGSGLGQIQTTLAKTGAAAPNISQSFATLQKSVAGFRTSVAQAAAATPNLTTQVTNVGASLGTATKSFAGIRSSLASFRSSIASAVQSLRGVTPATREPREAVLGLNASFLKLIATTYLVREAYRGLTAIFSQAQSIVAAGAQVETFQTRLVGLTGSASAAQQEYARLIQLAQTTPFTLPGVTEADITLRAFGDTNAATLKAVADLAAFMGEDIPFAAASYGRAFAAGAGAADILRERGVLTLVRLRTGVADLTKLTLPEFRKALFEAMVDPTGPIAGATDRLARTYKGALSNIEDAVFKLRSTIADAGLLDTLRDIAQGIVDEFQRLQADGTLERFAKDVGQGLADLASDARDMMPSLRDALAVVKDFTEGINNLRDAIVALGNISFSEFALGNINEAVRRLTGFDIVTQGDRDRFGARGPQQILDDERNKRLTSRAVREEQQRIAREIELGSQAFSPQEGFSAITPEALAKSLVPIRNAALSTPGGGSSDSDEFAKKFAQLRRDLALLKGEAVETRSAIVSIPDTGPANLRGPLGRIFKTPGGGFSTELVTTIGVDDRFVNTPLLVPGQTDIQGLLAGRAPNRAQLDRSLSFAQERGLPSFATLDEALEAERKRHATLDKRFDDPAEQAKISAAFSTQADAVEKLVESFGKHGEAVRQLAEEYVGLQTRQDAFLTDVDRELSHLKDPTAANIEALQTLAQKVETFPVKGEKMADALQKVRDQLQDVTLDTIKAGNALEKNLNERLQDLLDPSAKARREFSDLRAEAYRLGRTDLLPLVDQIEQVQAASDALHEVFGELQRGLSDVFEGLILGTSDVEDAFKHMAIAIVRSLTEMLVNNAVQGLIQLLLKGATGSTQALTNSGFTFPVGTGLTPQTQSGGSDAQVFGAIVGQALSQFGGGAGPSSFFGGTTGFSPASFFGSRARGGFQIPNTFGAGNIITTGGQAFFTGAGGAPLLLGGATAGALPAGATVGLSTAEFGAGASFADGTIAVGPGAGTAGAGAAGGASIASVLASIVGLVLSLGLAAKGLVDDRRSFNKVTLGTAQAQKNALTGIGAGSIAVGAIGGTVAGAAIGSVVPGIGNLVGAIVGAAVGTALGAAISSSLSGAVTKGVAGGLASRTVREGISQDTVNERVQKGVMGSALLQTLLAVVLGPIGLLVDYLGYTFGSPNVEKIVAKLFRKAIGAAGINTAGIGNDGSGLSREQRGLVTPEARSESRILGQLISALVGGGIGGIGDNAGNLNRQNRLTNLLTSGAARKASETGADIEDVIYSAFRRIFGSRLTKVINLFEAAFPGRAPNDRRDELQGGIGRAFAQQFAPLNVDKIVASMRDAADSIKNAFGKGPVKQSREAFRDSVGELFQGNDTNTAIANFTRKFASAIGNALQQGLGKVLERTLGDALAPVFAALRKALKQAINDGFDALGPKAQAKIQKSLDTLTAFISDPKFPQYIEQFVKIQQKFEQTVQDALIKGAAGRGDLLEAARLIKDELSDARALVTGFRDLSTNISRRIASAQAQFGDASTEAQLAPYKDRAAAARNELYTAAGIDPGIQPGTVLFSNILTNGTLKDNLPRALELLTQYSEAQLDYLEQSLQLAQQQKAVFEGLRQTFKNLADSIDVFRGGRKAERSLLDRNLEEARGLLPKALGGDIESATSLQQLLPTIFQQASNTYAPGSPRLQGILDFVGSASTQLEDKFGKLADQQTEAIRGLREEFKAFADVANIVSTFQAFAQNELNNKFAEVVRRLGTEGPLYDVLKSIALELGVPVDSLARNQPGATSGTVTHDSTDPRIAITSGSATSAAITNAPPPGLDTYGSSTDAAATMARLVAQTDVLLSYQAQLVSEQRQSRASAERIGQQTIDALADDGDTFQIGDVVFQGGDAKAIAAELAAGLSQGRFPHLADSIRRITAHRR